MIRTIDRDNRGRFALGNAGGPGRPPRQKEIEYLATLTEVCTLDDWQKICQRAVKDAKSGDHRSRDWLTKYLLPDPEIARKILESPSNEWTDENMVDKYAHVDREVIIAAMVAIDRLKKSTQINGQN